MSAKRGGTSKKELSFEKGLKKLEEIIGELEGGELPLEESLKSFEEGVKLAGLCSKKLEEAERRVEVLVRKEGGEMDTLPFDEA